MTFLLFFLGDYRFASCSKNKNRNSDTMSRKRPRCSPAASFARVFGISDLMNHLLSFLNADEQHDARLVSFAVWKALCFCNCHFKVVQIDELEKFLRHLNILEMLLFRRTTRSNRRRSVHRVSQTVLKYVPNIKRLKIVKPCSVTIANRIALAIPMLCNVKREEEGRQEFRTRLLEKVSNLQELMFFHDDTRNEYAISFLPCGESIVFVSRMSTVLDVSLIDVLHTFGQNARGCI